MACGAEAQPRLHHLPGRQAFLLGLQPDGRLSIFNRTFERCMGLWASPERLYISTLYQLWRFENALAPGQTHQGYDCLFVPQLAWTTGDLDIHDIAVDSAGRPVFVNSLFSMIRLRSSSGSGEQSSGIGISAAASGRIRAAASTTLAGPHVHPR